MTHTVADSSRSLVRFLTSWRLWELFHDKPSPIGWLQTSFSWNIADQISIKIVPVDALRSSLPVAADDAKIAKILLPGLWLEIQETRPIASS